MDLSDCLDASLAGHDDVGEDDVGRRRAQRLDAGATVRRLDHAVAKRSAPLLAKPYTVAELTRKVRDVLDMPA